MVIDAHIHLGSLSGREHKLAALTRYLNEAGVDRAFVSNLDAAAIGDGARDLDELDANLACLEAAKIETRLVPLYWVRPGRVDSSDHAFAGALDTEPFAGAFLAPRHNGFEADDARLDRHLSVLARLEKPVFVLVGRDDIARPYRAYQLAKRFPRTAVILCNTNPPAWGDCVDCVRQSVVREDSRLFLVTAHAKPEELQGAVRTIGADRLIFGSDGPPSLPGNKPATSRPLDAIRNALMPAEYLKVVSETVSALLV
jgi:predicted TIM-barrel fold metal-dependent hydrolase